MKLTISPRQLLLIEVLFWIIIAATYFIFPDRLVLITQILIAGLFAVSLDIALGYAGILTVGHAAFFGAGAYLAGLLAKYGWGEPFSALGLALIVCGVLGYLLSYLVVKGAELTRLMITIGICVMLYELANRFSSVTGGADGLQGVVIDPLFGLFEFDLWGKVGFIYTLSIVLLVFLGVRLMLKSPFGLALKGIHDNPRRMRAIGSPVDARLRTAYCFSAAIAGVAGALLAQNTQFVGLEMIGFNRSAEILIVLILGGTGRLYGGIIGAILYMCVHEFFADLNPQFWMFWLGIFLIVIVMVGRGGVLGGLARIVRIKETR
ncbi:MAG: branched-chain amino acid ABC transporter permease [Pigmentiphaga sp.]|nr:branched-chain amino acid ABC transporter permease [Pigmentiphaga sp.]